MAKHRQEIILDTIDAYLRSLDNQGKTWVTQKHLNRVFWGNPKLHKRTNVYAVNAKQLVDMELVRIRNFHDITLYGPNGAVELCI